MSTIANWAYTNNLQLWSTTVDEYGQPSYSFEYSMWGAYQLAGTLQADGNIPSSKALGGADIFYFEYLGNNPPKLGWRIALGEGTLDPAIDGKEIVSIEVYDVRMFGETIPDYKVGAI